MRAIFLSLLAVICSAMVGLSQQLPQDSLFTIQDTVYKVTDDVASTSPYTIKAKVDIPVFAVTAGLATYGFSRLGKKSNATQAEVDALKESNVNWFDRWAIEPYREKSDNLSYIPFYVSMPSPLILFAFDKRMRKDFFKLAFIYAEAVTITGALYGSAAGFTNRYRPMVYKVETPANKRLSHQQKKSFFAGHVALVGTSAFFMARVIADYHPQSKFKWLYYGLAGTVTAATGYLRIRAGEHFPSDVLLGTAVGTLSGLLTPALHRTKLFKNQRLILLPVGGDGAGLTAIYKL